VLIACVLPVVTHFILRTYGLQQIFGARGPVNALLMTAGAVQEPLPLTKSSFGTVIALTSWLLPVSVFFMYMVVRSVSRELLDAAVLLGATPVGVLRSVWIPQTSSGATLLLTINFCLAYGTYLSPRLLGGLEDLTVVVLIGQMLNEGRSAEAAMVGTVATVVPVLLMFVVLLVRRVYWRHGT
jgi:ABC-type spermidine/putrescine transport system permease subunit I